MISPEVPGGSCNAAEGYVATFVGGTQTIDHDERTDDSAPVRGSSVAMDR